MERAEFLGWDSPGPVHWQLVDGEPRVMAPASLPHNSILFELGRRIGNHFEALGGPCGIIPNPVLLIEILSPSNQAETWGNVWTYTTIPCVQETLVLRTSSIRADLLRRRPDGSWPEVPETLADGTLTLQSIGFEVELAVLYRDTCLAVR